MNVLSNVGLVSMGTCACERLPPLLCVLFLQRSHYIPSNSRHVGAIIYMVLVLFTWFIAAPQAHSHSGGSLQSIQL